MIIRIRSADEVSQVAIESAGQFLVSNRFQVIFNEDQSTNDDSRVFRREGAGPNTLMVVPHSNLYLSPVFPEIMTLTGVCKLGLFDFVLASGEGNQSSAMYWFLSTTAPNFKQTANGCVAYSEAPPPTSKIEILSNVDGLVVVADSARYSSAILFDTIVPFESS